MRNFIALSVLLLAGLIAIPITIAAYHMPAIPSVDSQWQLIAEDVTVTVYNACPEQCNADYLHTASMFEIDKSRLAEQRILAMERTMMKEYGLSYGMTVKIEGTGRYDGVWRLEDTMNRRYAGQHKVDLLMPDNIRTGKWKNVKIFKCIN